MISHTIQTLPGFLHSRWRALTGKFHALGLSLDVFLLLCAVILLNVHLAGLGSAGRFVFFPSAVYEGEWWRLLTHPFVHLSWYHLLLDAGAFFILYAGLEEKRPACKIAYMVAAGLTSLGSAWAFSPRFDELGLCGLSGIAHGLMAVSSLEMITGQKSSRMGWISLGVVVTKSIYEFVNGRVLFEFMHMGLCGTPLAASHLGGVVGGSIIFLVLKLLDTCKCKPN